MRAFLVSVLASPVFRGVVSDLADAALGGPRQPFTREAVQGSVFNRGIASTHCWAASVGLCPTIWLLVSCVRRGTCWAMRSRLTCVRVSMLLLVLLLMATIFLIGGMAWWQLSRADWTGLLTTIGVRGISCPLTSA